jgi:pimeloyl-ACP methyl ester carboxylesterase
MPTQIRAATERAFFLKLNVTQAALYSACAKNGNRAILEAMTTPLVVRDLERMAEALGEDGVNFWAFVLCLATRMLRLKGFSVLRVSYGTVIGSTLVAMKPQLVKRVLLDGVVDSIAYYNSPFDFVHNELADTHKVPPLLR